MIIKDKFIDLAVEEAKLSTYRFKVGCVIFDKSRIMSSGHNYGKSSRRVPYRFRKWPLSLHAEVDAILNAKKDLTDCNLLVVRINKYKQFRLAKPCRYCMMFIEHVNIKKIFYSIPDYPFIIEMDW